MAEQQDQDRTEQATPGKLREARNRGQVAKSQEINSFILLSAFLVIIYVMGEKMIEGQLKMASSVLSQAGSIELSANQSLYLFENMVNEMIDIFWPFMLSIIIVGVLANLVQTGPLFSLFPLKPDIQRLNPVAGFKRVFSTRLLFESFKSVIKLFLFGTVIYFALISIVPVLLALLDMDPDVYALVLLRESSNIIFKLLAVFFIVAVLDLMYTRWDFAKKMRMSRRDIKDEFKRKEGDPQVRAKLKELQKEASKRAASSRRVPDADVLITNPTHLAIGLKYERGKMPAPQLIAKGSGETAFMMRELAKKNNVPIIENKPLAKKLFKQIGVDGFITTDLFPVVAKVLVAAYAKTKVTE